MACSKTIKEYLIDTEVDYSEPNHSVRRLIVKLYRHFLPECDRQLPQYATCKKKLNYSNFTVKDKENTAFVSYNVCVERDRGTPFDSIHVSADFKMNDEFKKIMQEDYDDFNKESQRSLFNYIVRETFNLDVEDLCPDVE